MNTHAYLTLAVSIFSEAFKFKNDGILNGGVYRRLKCRNMAPPNSKFAKLLEDFNADPLGNSPWEFEQTIIKTRATSGNPSISFLKDDWAYLNHRHDPYQPAGVVEGGPQNYKGKGLKLPHGVDRQRTQRIPYHQDHGVFWRQRARMGTISFATQPDANQDVGLDETDMDIERRQWGSWATPDIVKMPALPSVWRSGAKVEDPEHMPYPWLYPYELFQPVPLHLPKPAWNIPPPDPDFCFAATGHFGGHLPNEPTLVAYDLERQKALLKEWDRLEAMHERDGDESVPERIEAIREALFSPPKFDETDDPMAKIATDAALARAREMFKLQANTIATDPQFIEYHLERIHGLGFQGGGCARYRGKEKTVSLCLFNYHPMTSCFKEYTTIEEMAELYHTLVTESRREGQVHTLTEIVTDPLTLQYPLKAQRREFPAIEAEYKPVWIHRKYGPEFGDAIPQTKLVQESRLTTFGAKIKRDSSPPDTKMGYIDDYQDLLHQSDG